MTARPSNRGRLRSSTMRSGRPSSILRNALSPSALVSTSKPANANSVRNSWRTDASSSTIRMRCRFALTRSGGYNNRSVCKYANGAGPTVELSGVYAAFRERMRRVSLSAALVFAGIALFSAQARAPQIESIREAELRADLFFLASDAMRGRLTDTPENTLTAEWIKARFERLGLSPAGAGHTYFHPFSLVTATLGSPNTFVLNARETAQVTLKVRQDFYPLRFSASGHVKGPVVFAGYGISAPAQGHDDYRTGTYAGRVVLVLNHEPGEHEPNSALDGVVT